MISRERLVPLSIIAFVMILLIGLPLERTGSMGSVLNFLVPSLTTAAIFAIICVGLNVQWGYTGIFNFGVVAFFMIGAYTAAIVTMPPARTEYARYFGGFGETLAFLPLADSGQWLPFLIAIIASAAASALLALVLALPTLRLREDYLAIAIIGVAELLRRVVIQEQGLVNGSRGLAGIPRPLSGWVESGNYKYVYFALVVAILVLIYLLVELGIRSPWGRVLRAIREDESAAAASGKNVFAFKTQGFVLGAAIMGVGGALYAFQQGSATPEAFTHFFGTFIFWAMLIVGGSGNNIGAVTGAFVIWGLWAITLQIQGYNLPAFVDGRIPYIRDFMVGVIIVLVLLVNPRGLLPEQARVSRWLERRVAAMRRAEVAAPPVRIGEKPKQAVQ